VKKVFSQPDLLYNKNFCFDTECQFYDPLFGMHSFLTQSLVRFFLNKNSTDDHWFLFPSTHSFQLPEMQEWTTSTINQFPE